METFDFNTIKDFDKHIELSIPNYKHIWELITQLSSYFILPETNVYDIGCSTGLGLKLLNINNNQKNVHYFGYDISDNLLQNIRQTNNFHIFKKDITDQTVLFENASLILSIFTLQFVDIKKRLNLLQRIYNGLNSGGSLIIAEKIYVNTGEFQDIFTFSYYDFKRKSFTDSEILQKQVDLRYQMKPLSNSENIELFQKAGFTKIESFFQSLNFKAWVLIK
jgi:tRNA (cmo5U34)-methyltransferase